MLQCNNAYEDFLVACGYFIRVNSVFNAGALYTWVLSDKFGNEYSGVVTTDGSALFDIPVSDLPEGILNPHAGMFTLRIKEGEDPAVCDWMMLHMAGKYDGINFYVKGGTHVKNELGCDPNCEIIATPA